MKYELEEIFKTFTSHIEESDRISEECIQRFKEYNPDKPVPDHMNRDFNFPSAMACICQEIMKLKENKNDGT